MLGDVVHGGLILGAVALFGILGYIPQGRELFRLLLEKDAFDAREILCAVGAAVLLSGLLFYIYSSFLPNLARDTQHDSTTLRTVAWVGLYTVAAAPWLSCAASVVGVRLQVAANRAELKMLIDNAGVPEIAHAGTTALALMASLESRAIPAIIAIAVLGILTVSVFHLFARSQRNSLSRGITKAFAFVAFSVFLGLALVPALTNSLLVDFFQAIGPLAAGLVAVGGVIVMGLGVGWFARVSGLAGYLAIALVLFVYWVGVSAGDFLAKPPPGHDQPAQGSDFNRSVLARPPGKTVVVSAQGGGMYAAIASSLIMARLNEDKKFLPSVLAVSSVSGGSLGIALHTALSLSQGCKAGPDGAPPDIETGIRNALLHPHLAPVLGNIAADLLRKSPFLLFFATTDRADAFAQSLINACPALQQPYSELSNDLRERPALVFNTTWMSNGHRVAFAPFGLQTIGDGTLWSFSDIYPKAAPYRYGKAFAPRIADAAVASARFPGILPPLSLSAGAQRLQFGDGAYADGSGVMTALDILEAAAKAAREADKEIHKADEAARAKSRLVMISFDYKPVAPGETAGTLFEETLGPLYAVLSVRDNLAQQAITRAERSNAITRAERSGAERPYESERFSLDLGLQLSRTSYEVLSLLVGRAEWCRDPAATVDARDNTILYNSCVAKRVKSWTR
jgi:hypothetical protein